MRAKEFINEAKAESKIEIHDTLPASYKIPDLKNSQNPYRQYRFGIMLAGAKGAEQRAKDGVPEFQSEAEWGDNEIIVSYGTDVGEFIDDALSSMGIKRKVKLSTTKSEESKTTGKNSPITPFKGYK